MSWSPNQPDSVDALFERRKAPVLALADDAGTVADEEKREARATDPRAAAIVDAMPPELPRRQDGHAHGRYRYFSPDEIEPLEVAE